MVPAVLPSITLYISCLMCQHSSTHDAAIFFGSGLATLIATGVEVIDLMPPAVKIDLTGDLRTAAASVVRLSLESTNVTGS